VGSAAGDVDAPGRRRKTSDSLPPTALTQGGLFAEFGTGFSAWAPRIAPHARITPTQARAKPTL
jgi:hypothetical protein